MSAQEEASTTRRLVACADGAIIAFGVFFGVLPLGLLYYMVGLGATMYYRERMQDAADASAFLAAIVRARGMNTLALINVVMAALLAVLAIASCNVIRVAKPLAANLSVLGKVAREYDPEVKAAVGIPPRLTLSVEDDKSSTCATRPV